MGEVTLPSSREIGIFGGVLVAILFANGGHSRTICSMCLTIPAALLTLKQIGSSSTQLIAYRASLSYWTVHAVFVVADSLIAETVEYSLLKFLLLIVIFLNAVRQDDKASRKTGNHSVRCSLDYGSYRSPTISSPVVTEATQFLSESPFIRSPVSVPSLASPPSSTQRLCELSAVTGSSYNSWTSWKTLSSTVENSEIAIRSLMRQAASQDADMSSIESNFESEGTPIVEDDTTSSLSHTEHSYNVQLDNKNNATLMGDTGFFEMDSCVSESLDPFWDSPGQIFFKQPFDETVEVTLRNSAECTLMWSLATRTPKTLVATQTCGITPPGSTIAFSLGVIDLSVARSGRMDQIAIDYVFVDPSKTIFDSSLFQHDEIYQGRKILQIYYQS